jgi:hypothetical protein
VKQRVDHALSYDLFHRVILEPTKIGNMRVLANYGGYEYAALLQTFILIRNIGNQTVKKDEVVGGVKIKSNGTILNGHLVIKDPGSCNPIFDIYEGNTGIVEFEFLRPGEGFLLAILHTDPDLGLDVWAEGPYIGNLKYRPVRFRQPIMVFVAFAFSILLGGSSAYLYKVISTGQQLNLPALAIIGLMVGFLIALGSYAGGTPGRRAERKFFELARS